MTNVLEKKYKNVQDHADLASVQWDEQRNRLTCIGQFYI